MALEKTKIQMATNIKRSTTRFSWCLVFLFVVFGVLTFRAEAASLYFSPSSGTYQTGRNFTVSVKVSSPTSMNAASGIVTFPTDKLEVLSVSKTGSIFNLWVTEPSFSNINSNGNGNIRFEGIVLNPGFIGDGKLVSVTFRNKVGGQAGLNFSSGSILANDGLGTNILSDMGSATFSLEAGVISAPEAIETPGNLPSKPLVKHYIKDQNGELILNRDSEGEEEWSNSRFNKFEWRIPSSVDGISILLNDRPSSNPGSKSDGFFDNKVYENLDDGIYYFHIRYINSAGAGSIEHFKIMVDAMPPEPFEIILPDGEITANPTPRIKFETIDKTSGVDRYEIKIDKDNWVDAATLIVASHILPKLSPGEHQILVRAYDKAENYTETETKLIIAPIELPKITEYPTNIISPGEILVLKGMALPKAKIEIHMNRRGGEEIIFNSQANEKGSWTAIYENVISSGVYEISAKQILDTSAESLLSQAVTIGVNSWFWRAWQWVKNVGGIIIIGLIILAGLVVAGHYFIHQFRMWRIKLRREVREAESTVASGFKKLKKEIKSGKTASKVLKDLSDIEKEIKDIEKK